MSDKVCDFHEDLAFGLKKEVEQDRLWKEWFTVHPATEDEDRRLGIDRIFYPHCVSAGHVPFRRTVQYKADTWIGRTGNVAIEYISNDRGPTLGGWLSTHAHWLSVYDVDNDVCYVLNAILLRQHFGMFWIRSMMNPGYEVRRCPQEHGGNTWSLLVPLSDLGSVYLFCVGEGIFSTREHCCV